MPEQGNILNGGWDEVVHQRFPRIIVRHLDGSTFGPGSGRDTVNIESCCAGQDQAIECKLSLPRVVQLIYIAPSNLVVVVDGAYAQKP